MSWGGLSINWSQRSSVSELGWNLETELTSARDWSNLDLAPRQRICEYSNARVRGVKRIAGGTGFGTSLSRSSIKKATFKLPDTLDFRPI